MSGPTLMSGLNAISITGSHGVQILKTKSSYKNRHHTYEDVERMANFLMDKTQHRPKIGIICGSGLGGLANMVEDHDVFAYKDIPNFPISTVPGHAGRLVFGKLGGKPCVCMQGRLHMYEGYSAYTVAMPVRVMKMMGVETLIVTNASGGLNTDFKVGDIMLMKDHINIPGMCNVNPLFGANDERFGPRFPPMSAAYDDELRQLARKVGRQLDMESYLKEGVYVNVGGPSYETIAESRMLKLLGADSVGMSTVPEVIIAQHCGMRVLGISLVTNKVIMDYDSTEKANHEEVLETGRIRGKDLQNLVATVVKEMPL